MKNALPLRDKALSIIGAIAVLRLPARRANVEPEILLLLLKKQGVKRLLIGKLLFASLAGVRPRLNVPFAYQVG